MNTKKQSKTNFPSRSFVVFWLPTFIWAVVICYLSLNDSDLSEIKFRFILESDKIAHLLMYFVLTVLLIRSWVGIFSSKALLYMLIISSVQVISFSILLEGLQKLLTSTRQFSFDDIFANIAGTVFGAIIMLIFYNYLSPKSSQNQ